MNLRERALDHAEPGTLALVGVARQRLVPPARIEQRGDGVAVHDVLEPVALEREATQFRPDRVDDFQDAFDVAKSPLQVGQADGRHR